jgi:hypothetical protein
LPGEGNHAPNVVAGGHIGLDETRATAVHFDRLHGLLARLRVNIGYDDERAIHPESEGDRASGTRGSSGH